MTILLWGLRDEAPVLLLRQALDGLDEPYVMLDQGELDAWELELCLVDGQVSGLLAGPEVELDLRSITAVYLRPYVVTAQPAVAAAGPGSALWQHVLALEEGLRTWLELTDALVVNPAEAMASNGSKPYQLELVRRAGFCTPPTLVTTDPQAALAFWETHGAVIYKSVSSVRSVVARLTAQHQARLAQVAACPTQFQAYVAGVDVRVHVVGGDVLACEIATTATDYRYPGDESVTIEACTLPDAVAARCVALAQQLNLPFAGIDLRHTAEDEWFCFEVNPSPGYSYYERRADLPISEALARLLIGGRR